MTEYEKKLRFQSDPDKPLILWYVTIKLVGSPSITKRLEKVIREFMEKEDGKKW